MSRSGRKPQGVGLLNPLSGSELAKRRMALFLRTLSGEIGVAQACAELQICESRFYGQRAEWLQESLSLLEPRPAGRPARPPATAPVEEIRALRDRLRESEARAAAFAVQAELAGALRTRSLPCAPGKKTAQPASRPPQSVTRAPVSICPAPPAT